MFKQLTFVVFAIASTSAHAGTYLGNPVAGVNVSHTSESLDGGAVVVDRVIFRACDGSSWVDDTDVSFDPVVGHSWSFPAGDWCAMDVVWATDVALWGTNANGDFEISSSDSWTRVSLDPAPGSAPLVPFAVDEGSVPSGHPRLHVSVD